AMVSPLVITIAIPVPAELMPVRRVHRSDQFEGVQRFTAGVHFLEDDADRFFGGRSIERNHWHTVALEVLQHFPLEGPERLTSGAVRIALPVFLAAALPMVPVKYLCDGVHERAILMLGSGKSEDYVASEVLADFLILRHPDNCF